MACHVLWLPDEVLLLALGHLGLEDLLATAQVCRRFRCVVADASLWLNPGDPRDNYADLGRLSPAAAACYGPLIGTYHLRPSNQSLVAFVAPTALELHSAYVYVLASRPTLSTVQVLDVALTPLFGSVCSQIYSAWMAQLCKTFPNVERLRLHGTHIYWQGSSLDELRRGMTRLAELVVPSFQMYRRGVVASIEFKLPHMAVTGLENDCLVFRRKPQ
jgi:hypothetical protein